MTTEEEMEGPISFLGHKEQESNLILPEHDDDDDGDDYYDIRAYTSQCNLIFRMQKRTIKSSNVEMSKINF
jgi:hypothetical protein